MCCVHAVVINIHTLCLLSWQLRSTPWNSSFLCHQGRFFKVSVILCETETVGENNWELSSICYAWLSSSSIYKHLLVLTGAAFLQFILSNPGKYNFVKCHRIWWDGIFHYARLPLPIKPSLLFAQSMFFSVENSPLLYLPDFPRLLQRYNKEAQIQTVRDEAPAAEGEDKAER